MFEKKNNILQRAIHHARHYIIIYYVRRTTATLQLHNNIHEYINKHI